MVMEFYPRKNYVKNGSNWWVPTSNCLGNMVAAAGFGNIEKWKLIEEPIYAASCRGFVSGSKLAPLANSPV